MDWMQVGCWLDVGWMWIGCWLDAGWTVCVDGVDTVEARVRTWEMPSRRAPDCNHVCHHHYQRRDHLEHHHEKFSLKTIIFMVSNFINYLIIVIIIIKLRAMLAMQ